MDERNVIYRMLFQGYKPAEIARCLGRHRSTIRRECKRNANVEGRYDPDNAQTLAHSRRRAHLRRPKTGHRRLMAYVAVKTFSRKGPFRPRYAGSNPRIREVGLEMNKRL